MRNFNRQWRLAAFPEGMPKVSDWTLEQVPIPEPEPGQMLVKAHYLDVAPYMRGRISNRKSYIQTRYDIAEGFEQTPAAFLRLLHSENIGKQLVEVDG